MRILVVADEYPWPPRTGYRQRLHWVLRTLAGQGTVDLLVVGLDGRTAEPPPADVPLATLAVVRAGARTEPRVRRLGRWVVGRRPRSLLWRDWAAPREALRQWSDRTYDVVWFSHAPAYLALADLVDAPHVVDLDNLDSSVLRHRRRNLVRTPGSSRLGRLATRVGAAADAVDERRWHRLERTIAEAGATVVVCSELDRDRLGRGEVRVVPNGYERSASPAPTDRDRTGTAAPVLIMVGLLTYEPNRDAAELFATTILPLVRRDRPGARFRLVGRYDSQAAVAAFRGLPGVDVLGAVEDLAPELAAADVAVVPIRFGGGTRIKILEAFAHRLPVVSTTVGCEGLDVVDGEHLLVADDPAAFAAACLRLGEDAGLRARLVSAAEELWRSRYRWTVLAPAVVEATQAARARHGEAGHAALQADHDDPRAGSASQ